MAEQTISRAVTTVTLPKVVDSLAADAAYDQLYAAFAVGAAMVVADFTATAVCDPGALRRLLAVRNRAVARGVPFRLVAPPGNPVRGTVELTGSAAGLKVYSTARAAAAAD